MGRTMNETLLRHPEIVVHLGKIFVSGIDYEADNALRFLLFTAITQGAADECARGRPAENSFLAQQLADCGEAFRVINLECFRHQRHISYLRNKILADAFDGPAACFVQLAGFNIFEKHGALWIGQDHFDSASRFNAIEKSPETSQGPTRTDSYDNRKIG